jgi:hypothetical protein
MDRWDITHTATDGIADAIRQEWPEAQLEDMSWGEAIVGRVTIDGKSWTIEVVVQPTPGPGDDTYRIAPDRGPVGGRLHEVVGGAIERALDPEQMGVSFEPDTLFRYGTFRVLLITKPAV